jgi:hypothetical protein
MLRKVIAMEKYEFEILKERSLWTAQKKDISRSWIWRDLRKRE